MTLRPASPVAVGLSKIVPIFCRPLRCLPTSRWEGALPPLPLVAPPGYFRQEENWFAAIRAGYLRLVGLFERGDEVRDCRSNLVAGTQQGASE